MGSRLKVGSVFMRVSLNMYSKDQVCVCVRLGSRSCKTVCFILRALCTSSEAGVNSAWSCWEDSPDPVFR